MANVVFEYRIEKGAPDERLCGQLGTLSQGGWQVAGIAHCEGALVCLLRREKDFEVAQSLHEALEESATVADAIARQQVPAEEIGF